MAEQQLALEWLGGPTERRLRVARPAFAELHDELPWESFDPARADPDDLVEARRVWTNGVFTEYASAAAFSAMNLAFLQCGAPVDLCAAAADFALDELVHVTLVSRLVMALGGATPYVADLERIAPSPRPELPARLRAAELAIKISCVGEALSLPALTASHRGASHPLARAVLETLRHDEGPHASIGHWFLAWAGTWLTAGDRDYLGAVARDAIAVYEPLWRDPEAAARPVLDHAGETTYRAYMEDAVEHRIVRRLTKAGVVVPRAAAVDA
jgi:hypothetical protein